MKNKNKDYIWTYDSAIDNLMENDFWDDDSNDIVNGANLENGLLFGDMRPELKAGIVAVTEYDYEVEADDLSDVEVLNESQIINGRATFEVITDFRSLIKEYAADVAKGNDFKIELKYNTDLAVFTMESVVYNGSFMTKDIVTTIDAENNIKAVL